VLPGSARRAGRWIPLVFWSNALIAQTCLMVSNPIPISGGAARVDISLYSSHGSGTAALQWRFQYPSPNAASITIQDGPSLIAAAKTAMCLADETGYNCVAVGANNNAIGSGVVVTVSGLPYPAGRGSGIQIVGPSAASPEGYFVPIRVSSDCRLHPERKVPSAK